MKCKICNREFKSITHMHLKHVHDMTVKEYLDRFKLEPNELCSSKLIETCKDPERRRKQSETLRQQAKEGLHSSQQIGYKTGASIRMKQMAIDGNHPWQSNRIKNSEVNSKRMKKLASEGKHIFQSEAFHCSQHYRRSMFAPNKDPVTAFLSQIKSRKTRIASGNVSKGSKQLYRIMDAMSESWCGNFKYKKEYPVGNYFLDVAIPSLKVNIEYDGYYKHYTSNIESDLNRNEILNKKGWRILRIGKFIMFKDIVSQDIWNFIHSEELIKYVGYEEALGSYFTDPEHEDYNIQLMLQERLT